MSKDNIIRDSYSLLNKLYNGLIIIHENSNKKAHIDLLKEIETFELKHGIEIEKILATRTMNSDAAKKIATA